MKISFHNLIFLFRYYILLPGAVYAIDHRAIVYDYLWGIFNYRNNNWGYRNDGSEEKERERKGGFFVSESFG